MEKDKTPLVQFDKDGKTSYFDYRDGKWQFWGDLSVDESAVLFFEKLASYLPSCFNMEEFKKIIKKNDQNKM